MSKEQPTLADDDTGPLATYRQFVSLERDVLVLSLAMFAFSLGFQMTSRYVPEYLAVLGASTVVIGLFGTVQNVIQAVYPYPGGAFSDRVGSRYALTLFATLSSLGFLVWILAPTLGTVTVGGVTFEPWIWIFVGLFLAQAWKSLGLGATFAVVRQSVPPSQLARGFASTEVFRRSAFLVAPLLAAGVLYVSTDFTVGFQYVLAVTLLVSVVATVAQHVLYEAEADSVGKQFAGVRRLLADLRDLPPELKPLLVGDTLVRFANGMVYVFFVIVVTRYLEADLQVGSIHLEPAVFFGVLLAVEMAVALVSMPPAAKLAESVGLKPVVGLGFFVYAIFPVLLISVPRDAPGTAALLVALFAFSGLRFAGLPAHKALIVGPSERDSGGRVAGAYYLLRNVVVIPSAAIGGAIYGGVTDPITGTQVLAGNPPPSFGLATVVGPAGTAYFPRYGEEFDAYD
jgi:MFS family permease